MPVVLGAASAFTTRRLVFYGMASTIAAFAIIINAFRQRPNFYSATVMLGGSNGCMMVLINFGIFLTLCFGKLCQKVFFGPLRAIEIEHLHERLWYAVTETLLAMTIFRDDFDSSFAILFGTLLFLKVFHWLSADRVEYMEQTPSVGRLFHVRMISVLSMLFEFDLFLATFAVEVLIIDKDRKGIMIMFANEFFILGATLWSTIAKYLINCQDMRSEEPWEAKSLYVFFVDLITDFLKLATYIACFCLILSFYGGLPLHIFRDVYVTGMSFFSRLRDFMKYRAATRNMDTRFPDATSAELRSMSDGTCIICREEMVARNAEAGEGEGESRGEGETQGQSNQPTPATPNNSGLNETPKKLPCGHIFHFYCLRSWLERQQSCPTCRRTVFATNAGDQQTQVQGQGGQGVGVAGMAPGAVAAAGNGQQNGAVNGNPPTQTQQNTGNANRSSRDQLQAFLQQIQNDAQRMRQEHLDRNQRGRGEEQNNQTPNQRVIRADNSDSVAGQNSEPIVDRNGNPTRTMLIKSLFNVKSTPSSSTRNRQEEGNPYVRRSNLPPAPSLSGLSAYNSLDRSGDPNDTYIPPPPWTLRSSRRSNLQPLAGSSKQTSPDNSKQNTGSEDEERKDTEKVNEDQSTKAKEQEKEEEKVDPVDAREAARAAALRRFQNHQGQSSATPTTETVSKATASSEKINDDLPPAESSTHTPQRLLPGNPHLIPLFDTSSVQGYTRNHAAQLPYPLIEHKQSQTAERARTNSGLEDRLNSLNLQSLSLTDQEMSNLSKRTRQGLEERLRLLYRVEGAVSDLVEELTRALSALPGEDEILNDQSTNDIQDRHNLDVNDKGKAPIEGIHARI